MNDGGFIGGEEVGKSLKQKNHFIDEGRGANPLRGEEGHLHPKGVKILHHFRIMFKITDDMDIIAIFQKRFC
jgi:hypothetical protein